MMTQLEPSPRKETAYTNFDAKKSSQNNISMQHDVSAKTRSSLPNEMVKYLREEAAVGLESNILDLIGEVKPVFSIIVPHLQSSPSEEALLNNQSEKIFKRWKNAVIQAGIEDHMDVLHEGVKWLVITASLKGSAVQHRLIENLVAIFVNNIIFDED